MVLTIPAGCEPYQNDIRRFVDAMLYKMDKNAHKGRWVGMDIIQEVTNLEAEVEELKEAIRNRNTVEIMLEAADVANFALIINSIALDHG